METFKITTRRKRSVTIYILTITWFNTVGKKESHTEEFWDMPALNAWKIHYEGTW